MFEPGDYVKVELRNEAIGESEMDVGPTDGHR